MKMDLVKIYKNTSEYLNKQITVEGWVRNHRKQKEFGFIDFSDGTCFKTLQVVYDNKLSNFDDIQKIRVGSAVSVTGTLIESPKEGQPFELQVESLELLGDSPENYPIQPKRHTREFLREQAYLRPRTNLFQAVFRIRSLAAMAIHEYFQSNGYVYVHTPLITCADCEGSDQMFKITTLDFDNIEKDEDGKADMSKDLFGQKAFVTGSGQLHGEAFALAYKKLGILFATVIMIVLFAVSVSAKEVVDSGECGPTFRTENSNTKIHANEFWMIEPEIAFCDLNGLMDIEEEMLKYVVNYVLERAQDELSFLDSFVEKGLLEKLTKLVNSEFTRITHEEAINILKIYKKSEQIIHFALE